MSDEFFDRLERDLARLTRSGAHLSAERQARRRVLGLTRRGLVAAALIVALAMSLVSEFPASAGGHVGAGAAIVVLSR